MCSERTLTSVAKLKELLLRCLPQKKKRTQATRTRLARLFWTPREVISSLGRGVKRMPKEPDGAASALAPRGRSNEGSKSNLAEQPPGWGAWEGVWTRSAGRAAATFNWAAPCSTSAPAHGVPRPSLRPPPSPPDAATSSGGRRTRPLPGAPGGPHLGRG